MLSWWSATAPIVTAAALKVIGAIILFLIGRWLIGLCMRLLSRVLALRRFDPTLTRYLLSILNVGLNVVFIVAILGFLGVETTSFAALLAGVGLAVGAAWSGLLANFAAGAFFVIFRPFKAGDYVLAAGVEGTVIEIGLFNTTLLTPDSVTAIIGNAKVSGETIKNFSTNRYRRVDRTAQLAFGVDPFEARARLKSALASIPNVASDPAPDVEILEFNAMGTLLAVRPYCHTDHYWQVYFATNRAIAATFEAAGYPLPYVVRANRAGPPSPPPDLKSDVGTLEFNDAAQMPLPR